MGTKLFPVFLGGAGGADFGPVHPLRLLHRCSLGEGKPINTGSPATDLSGWKRDSRCLPQRGITYRVAGVGCFWVCKAVGLEICSGGPSLCLLLSPAFATIVLAIKKPFPKPSIRVIQGLKPKRRWCPPPATCSRASLSVPTLPTSGWILRNPCDGDCRGHLKGGRLGPWKQLAPLADFYDGCLKTDNQN